MQVHGPVPHQQPEGHPRLAHVEQRRVQELPEEAGEVSGVGGGHLPGDEESHHVCSPVYTGCGGVQKGVCVCLGL